MTVLLRGVGRESAPRVFRSQVNLLTIINFGSTGCVLQGLGITCFDFAGRATGSIALGTQKEKPDFAGFGPNCSTLLASFFVLRPRTPPISKSGGETHRDIEVGFGFSHLAQLASSFFSPHPPAELQGPLPGVSVIP